MAIELQNASPGNHRVGGGHRQSSKVADAGQAGNALGFAALMSLVSDQEPGSDAVVESTGLALMPAAFDGKPALPDVNETLVAGQLTGGEILTFPTLPPMSLIAATQAEVSSGGVDSLLLPSDAKPGMCFSQPGDVSNPPVALSQITQTQTQTQTQATASQLAAANEVAVPGATSPASIAVMTEGAADAVPADPMAAKATNALVSAVLAVQGQQPQVIRSRGEPPSDTTQTAVPVPLVSIDTKASSSTSMQIEKTPVTVSRVLVDIAKGETKLDTRAKQASFTSEPTAQIQSSAPVPIQIAGMVDENIPVVAPKASGAWTSQQISLASQVRQDANELVSGFTGRTAVGSAALPGQVMALAPKDTGALSLERPTKHPFNRFGSGGEGVYGQPLASANPADSLFQVVPTTSAAASTVVAETVSYWASQGVHSASLQLEGLGDEPVEVRISVNGDMAKVDFRTNQPEVRQAIEAAASQLKELLTSQGIQLTGMSIGTSGRGGSQEKDTKRTPEGRKVAMLKSEAVEKPRLRGANPSVGQALDLFV